MSIWDDVDDGFTTRIEVSGEENEEFFPASSMKALEEAFPSEFQHGLDGSIIGITTKGVAPDTEMPPQKISATDLTITAIENDGQIIGIRISGIHGIRPEENFHSNMRLEEDEGDILLYDKEWAAIHQTELDIVLNCNGEEPEENG